MSNAITWAPKWNIWRRNLLQHTLLLWYYCPDQTLTASTMSLHLLPLRTSVFQPSSPALVVSPDTSTGLLWCAPFTTISLRSLHHLSWFWSTITAEGSDHEAVMTQPQTSRTRVPSSTWKLLQNLSGMGREPTAPVFAGQSRWSLNFRHCASCILRQAFHYSPENAFYIFNQQIYFIIWYLLDRASLI